MKKLHIYSQYQQHDDAVIIGTREALEALQKALNQLISSGKSEKDVKVEFECHDGESYDLFIQMKPDLGDDNLPYISWKNGMEKVYEKRI